MVKKRKIVHEDIAWPGDDDDEPAPAIVGRDAVEWPVPCVLCGCLVHDETSGVVCADGIICGPCDRKIRSPLPKAGICPTCGSMIRPGEYFTRQYCSNACVAAADAPARVKQSLFLDALDEID